MQQRQTSLAGRHVFITGAARGIGQAIARQLGHMGADLTLTARNRDSLQGTVGELKDLEIEINCLALDLARPEAVAELIASSARPIDILVNNAGLAPSAALDKTRLDEWRLVHDVNVTAPFLAAQAVVPGMKERGWGRIINLASTAGLTGYPYTAAYVASKHGLVGLTRALAKELARTGITVNAVCPGFTDTDIAKGAINNIVASGKTAAEAEKILARGNPLGRLIQPREVAETVAWLCQDGSMAINGQAIAVDGGEVMA